MEPLEWTRRKVMQMFDLLADTLTLPIRLLAHHEHSVYDRVDDDSFEPLPVARAITSIVIGAGARGTIYANYANAFPSQLSIIGVADPSEVRRTRMSRLHGVPESRCFENWEEVFEHERFADAVIIATPDHLHTGPCLKALEKGYHVLIEKPVAPTEAECRQIAKKAAETGCMVAVCHVLRYAPYFRHLKAVIDSGAIGKVISMQHLEPIEHVHMAHSYVRGHWHNSQQSSPIILAKCCHDMDVLRWLVGKPARQISAFGDRSWFKAENAPEGSTARCMDGCAVERECPYSALKIYHRYRKRLYVFDLPEDPDMQGDTILQYLRNTDYGRCVYRMANDQPDHITASILFEDGVTASFSMEAFTSYEGRRTRIMGSLGDITGDMTGITVTSFATGETSEWKQRTDSHGGGDWRLVADFIQALDKNDPALLSSSLDISLESHLMCFAAERSRTGHRVEPVHLDKGSGLHVVHAGAKTA